MPTASENKKTNCIRYYQWSRGDLHALRRESGGGKSTLLHIAGGLISPTSGSVLLDGREVLEAGAERGMVFQAYTLFPRLSVRHNVEFGPKQRGVKKAERERLAQCASGSRLPAPSLIRPAFC